MLPKIPYIMKKNKQQAVSFGGINYSNVLREGELADSLGVSARAYPYLSTRKAPRELPSLSGAGSIAFFKGNWVVVKGTELYYGGEAVGTVTPGEKQFAPINSKLVIYPDMVYLDTETKSLKSMGAETWASGVTFTANTLTLKDSSFAIAKGRGGVFSGSTLTVEPTKEVWSRGITLFHGSDYTYFKIYYSPYVSVEAGATIVTISPGYANVILSLVDLDELVGTRLEVFNNTIHNILSCVLEDGAITIEVDAPFPYDISWVRLSIPIGRYVKAGDTVSVYVGGRTVGPAKIDHISGSSAFFEEDILSGENWTGTIGNTGTITRYDWVDLRERLQVGLMVYFPQVGVRSTITAVTETTVTIEDEFPSRTIGDNVNLSIQYVGSGGLTDFFKVGDVVDIKKVSGETSEDNDLTVKISELTSTTLTVANDVFTEGEDASGIIHIERRIPELDFICSGDNRIFGCSSADNTVYASALGDPTNFFDYTGVSTDSYAVAVGSEGDFTGCTFFGGSVLFFKERVIHKLMGSYPAEYALYEYQMEGVQKGSHKSLVIINEVLYYKGIHGVFAFTSSPSLISANFGDRRFHSAVGGSDGDTYFLSMQDDEGSYLFTFDTVKNVWMLEGREKVADFASNGGDTYILTDGQVCLYGAQDSEKDMEWFAQFTPFYETIEGRKSYSRLLLRIELPRDSYIVIETRFDNGIWHEAGKIVGKREGVIPVVIPINRCDKFEIRLRGKGKCTILSMMREYFVGSGRS